MVQPGVRVAGLARFPVKACAAEPCDEVEAGVAGLRNDRVLAVVSGDRIMTQRELPALARVHPSLDDETALLSLWADGPAGEVQDVVSTQGAAREVLLFGEPVRVVDQSSSCSQWLSDVLGQPVRLVAAPETTRRASPGEVPGLTVLSDGASVSLHSLASVARLNEALAERGEPAVPADRFRANIVLDGCEAHAEDSAGRVEVGPVVLRFAELDPRCAVTTVDQVAGKRTGPEPLRTLAGYRRGATGEVVFGTYLTVETPGVLKVGDPVRLGAR
jgi:uncharacterized protein YcbX